MTRHPALTAARRALHADVRGATLTEFAIVAPVMCLFLVGAFDFAHTLYLQAALQGVVQKTSRDSSLEGNTSTASQAAIDEKVRQQVIAIAGLSTITITRNSYRTFSAASEARAEDYTDSNGNGTCDGPIGATPGESYVDANNNNNWDRDGGDASQGGAKDKTIYTVSVSYPRMLPLDRFIDVPPTVNLTARTVLQNQPYTDQAAASTTVRNCT